MAENDITVGMTLEDAAAMAKLNEFESKLGQVQEKARMASGPMSGILTPIPEVFGGPKGASMTPLLDAATEAAKRNAGATKELTEATNELGEATGRAGINIEAMGDRMLARLGLMEVIRLAMQGVSAAFKEVAAQESSRVYFENMTVGVQEATEAEKILEVAAKETNIPIEKLYPALIKLEDAGEGPKAAAIEVEALGKFAAATHGEVDPLAKAIANIRLGTASVQEMFDLAHRTGEAKDEMVRLVTEYANLQKEITRTDHARAEELATMREQAAVTERTIADQQKLAGIQESFLEKMLAAEGKPPGQVDPVLARAMEPGGLPQTAGGAQMTKDIELGFQQIYKEEGLTTEGMQHFVDTGVIGIREIMAAAKRMHDAEKEARTREIEELAKEDTAAKKGEKVELDQKRLELAGKFSEAIDDQANASAELAKYLVTIDGKVAEMGTNMREAAKEGTGLANVIKGIVDSTLELSRGFATLGGGAPTRGVVMTDQHRGAGVPGGGKVEVKDENSDESIRLLRQMADHLSGQGTP